MSFLNRISFALIYIIFTSTAQAHQCPSCGLSKASDQLSLATSKVLSGSIDMSAATGSIVIESVVASADTTIIVAKASGEAASVTIELSGKGLQQLGLASGKVLSISATTTGHLLISAGKAIAFIPNEIGKALIHHEKIQ
jgi:hypothetical protein